MIDITESLTKEDAKTSVFIFLLKEKESEGIILKLPWYK